MAEIKRKKQKSISMVARDAIMTGISYMIPVIVGPWGTSEISLSANVSL